MKKEDIPQDKSALDKFTKELCYAVDSSGNYVTGLSRGWDVKATALDLTWQDIDKRIAEVKQKVLNKEASPLLFFLELRLMDLTILAAYSGFWQWQIKRHMKPEVFEKLSKRKLEKYAKAFNVSVEQLKTMNVNAE
ncbi:hypothetical protein [Aurantibacillus circumpalustris]|uniref:hypothetical protein n=1 Tax=Aurantibacillus circumpalustris TaxID=3036359 RepID=UPI00295AE2C1|nr:hypothetical protein [Aurantibacillus circumpalustris]